jgi:fumarylacetoacetase
MAHLTINGASIRTGDLLGSGTVSSYDVDKQGSLLELSWGATKDVELSDGSRLQYLRDGDEVTISAVANMSSGTVVDFGSASGCILPAR